MSFLNRLIGRKRLPNIPVYVLSAIVDGQAKSTPVGVRTRFSDDYEKLIREKYRPLNKAFLNENLSGVPVILSWSDGIIDAVCYISANDAPTAPGFKVFDDDILVSVLKHFP